MECGVDRGLDEHDAESQCGSDEEVAESNQSQHASSNHDYPGVASDSDGINVDTAKSDPTPPTSSTPTSFYSLRSRNKSKLVYDARYHPMDDAIRPTQAAKLRSAHGEKQVCFASDDLSDAFTANDSDEEQSSEHSEAEEELRKYPRGKKRKFTQSQLRSVEPTRRSSRKVSELKISYNMNVHPQDKFLSVSSDDGEAAPKKKAKKSKHTCRVDGSGSNDGIAPPKSTRRKHADYVSDSESDGLKSSDEHFRSGIEVESDAVTIAESLPASPVLDSPKGSEHGRNCIDSPHLSLGEPDLCPEKDAWPISPGQPFQIYHEKLEDQLHREASAASPLKYEHDDKENATDNAADTEPPSETYAGVSIIPESQYTPSSEDRQFSSCSALANNALYGDPFPQTYGLDGAYCSDSEKTNGHSKGMSVRVFGRSVPVKQAQAEPDSSQDSVFGHWKSDEATEG
ncbi:uncharacterized protein SETTUDRAFT_39376 [Exserohilum turcica Et28A]|uniref:Uncharacterized protein n=1 Tax=Exserohilum turcicum (strain 28A) TaxID=671987 RepID=R0KE54_EXST2|nr:uncharacterized protein SETTUDRAFT_39376 [Exserohilum turcica Et28A]EOA87594.1 hypothetical protein SETTUDRAFT_39376 [Exserohilum turcica Et28A]